MPARAAHHQRAAARKSKPSKHGLEFGDFNEFRRRLKEGGGCLGWIAPAAGHQTGLRSVHAQPEHPQDCPKSSAAHCCAARWSGRPTDRVNAAAGSLPTTTIVVAVTRLPAGHVLTNDDLTTRDGRLRSGTTTSCRRRCRTRPHYCPCSDAGELSESKSTGWPRLAGNMGDTTAHLKIKATLVAAPVRLADPGNASSPGDVVDVIAARASDGGGQSARSGGKRRSRRHDRGRGHKARAGCCQIRNRRLANQPTRAV